MCGWMGDSAQVYWDALLGGHVAIWIIILKETIRRLDQMEITIHVSVYYQNQKQTIPSPETPRAATTNTTRGRRFSFKYTSWTQWCLWVLGNPMWFPQLATLQHARTMIWQNQIGLAASVTDRKPLTTGKASKITVYSNNILFLNKSCVCFLYIYIYMFVCVCVCVYICRNTDTIIYRRIPPIIHCPMFLVFTTYIYMYCFTATIHLQQDRFSVQRKVRAGELCCIHVCVCVYMFTCVNACVHTHTHTHRHTIYHCYYQISTIFLYLTMKEYFPNCFKWISLTQKKRTK